MEKINKHLSRGEQEALDILRKNELWVFRAKDLRLLLGRTPFQAYNLLKALRRKQAISKAGHFFIIKGSDEGVVGQRIGYPCYLSFWSALSYYGLSDQRPFLQFLVTTRYRKSVGNWKYITLTPRRFFGYCQKSDLAIAEQEKAVIDSLLLPKYGGGIKEIGKALQNINLDKEKLIRYAQRMGSKVVLRRLGFLLEGLGWKKGLAGVRRNIGKGVQRLDPSLPWKNNVNKRWLLDVNL